MFLFAGFYCSRYSYEGNKIGIVLSNIEQTEISFEIIRLKVVCHVSDWPQQSPAYYNGFLYESGHLKQMRAGPLHFLRP